MPDRMKLAGMVVLGAMIGCAAAAAVSAASGVRTEHAAKAQRERSPVWQPTGRPYYVFNVKRGWYLAVTPVDLVESPTTQPKVIAHGLCLSARLLRARLSRRFSETISGFPCWELPIGARSLHGADVVTPAIVRVRGRRRWCKRLSFLLFGLTGDAAHDVEVRLTHGSVVNARLARLPRQLDAGGIKAFAVPLAQVPRQVAAHTARGQVVHRMPTIQQLYCPSPGSVPGGPPPFPATWAFDQF
jgi:hypothetical protein